MTTIINIDNLDTIKSKLPLADELKIYGIKYVKAQPKAIIKIMKALKRLEQAAQERQVDAVLYLKMEAKARDLWQWAINEFGEDTLRQEWAGHDGI